MDLHRNGPLLAVSEGTQDLQLSPRSNQPRLVAKADPPHLELHHERGGVRLRQAEDESRFQARCVQPFGLCPVGTVDKKFWRDRAVEWRFRRKAISNPERRNYPP